MRRVPSPNHDARDRPVDILVVHYTGMTSAKKATEWLCDLASKVSAHYLIDEAGDVVQMVDEERRAWHAGVSYWRGNTDVNGASIGIELANPGHEFGYQPFPEAQVAALIDLATGIVARHGIGAGNVVGHSDVAPARKTDPGELFPWRRLAAAGLGVWPEDGAADGGDLDAALAAIGYGGSGVARADLISAFQRRFRPANFDGVEDAETRGLAAAVARLVADT